MLTDWLSACIHSFFHIHCTQSVLILLACLSFRLRLIKSVIMWLPHSPPPPPSLATNWLCRLPLSGSYSGSALGTGSARAHPSTHTQLILQINESLQQMSPWLWVLSMKHEIYCYHLLHIIQLIQYSEAHTLLEKEGKHAQSIDQAF